MGGSCVEAVLPFKKSWLYFSSGAESRPMTRSSSSSASSLTEAVVLTTATFLVGGRAEERAGSGGGSGGGFSKVGQEVAIWPFCWHQRQCPSLKHFSLSSGVSFLGFSLVSTSIALGSLEEVLLVRMGDLSYALGVLRQSSVGLTVVIVGAGASGG